MNNYTNTSENTKTSEKIIKTEAEPLECDISTSDQDKNNMHIRTKQERSPSPVNQNMHFQTSPSLNDKSLATPNLVDRIYGSAKSESPFNECPPSVISITNNEGRTFHEEPKYAIRSFEIPQNTKQCHICYKTFFKRGMLVKHYGIAHHIYGDRVLKKNTCRECGHFSRQYNKLRTHYRIHHPSKLFTCDVCSEGFLVIKSLKRHYKRCHIEHSTRSWYEPVFKSNDPSSIENVKYSAVPTDENEPTDVIESKRFIKIEH